MLYIILSKLHEFGEVKIKIKFTFSKNTICHSGELKIKVKI